MTPPGSPAPPRTNRFRIIWYTTLFGLVFLSFPLRDFDDSIELRPDHSGLLWICVFALGVPMAIVSGVLAWRGRSSGTFDSAVGWFGVAIVGLVGPLLFLTPAFDIAFGIIDFPPSKTRTYQATLPIARASVSHGKGRHWQIETTQFQSDLDIVEADYDWMLAHRPAGDRGTDPDEIASNGSFCARVTMQQAGDALRVLHAGSRSLPSGSIVPCPPPASPGMTGL